MRDKYYYLVASLPALYFDESSDISREEFIEECGKWVSADDLNNIKTADISDPYAREEDPSIVKEWKDFDLEIKTELEAIRKKRIRSGKKTMSSILRERIEGKNPLEKEKAVAKIKWEFIGSIENKHMFDLGKLILYFLKVQILERLSQFDKEKGKLVFEQLSGAQYE